MNDKTMTTEELTPVETKARELVAAADVMGIRTLTQGGLSAETLARLNGLLGLIAPDETP